MRKKREMMMDGNTMISHILQSRLKLYHRLRNMALNCKQKSLLDESSDFGVFASRLANFVNSSKGSRDSLSV